METQQRLSRNSVKTQQRLIRDLTGTQQLGLSKYSLLRFSKDSEDTQQGFYMYSVLRFSSNSVQTQYSLSTGSVQTQFQRYFSFFNRFNEIIERYFEIIFRQYRLCTDSVETQYRLNKDSVQTQHKDDIRVFFGKLKKYLSLHTPHRLFSECCLKITKRIQCNYLIIFHAFLRKDWQISSLTSFTVN